jgi:hypothetical protein
MGFNPLTERGMPVESRLRDWRWLNSVPYDKLAVEQTVAKLTGKQS